MPVLHAQTAGLQDMAVHATALTPALEIAREAAMEAMLISARSAATQAVKFAKDIERNIIMTMRITYGRASSVVGIETTAIPGMSHVIHVVAKGTLTAIGRVKCKNQFRAHAAIECSWNMSM
jgi:hypothetical protein